MMLSTLSFWDIAIISESILQLYCGLPNGPQKVKQIQRGAVDYFLAGKNSGLAGNRRFSVCL